MKSKHYYGEEVAEMIDNDMPERIWAEDCFDMAYHTKPAQWWAEVDSLNPEGLTEYIRADLVTKEPNEEPLKAVQEGKDEIARLEALDHMKEIELLLKDAEDGPGYLFDAMPTYLRGIKKALLTLKM